MDTQRGVNGDKQPFQRRKYKKNLNKNQSVKIFKEKQKKRIAFAQQRESLQKQYEVVNSSEIERFDQLPLTPETLKGLKKRNYFLLTDIQQQAIMPALKGLDILGAAKTGSGKTLAFVIPILERLFCEGWCKNDGLGALVITPTRELAMQIHEVCVAVGTFHGLKMGLVIGGKDLREEKKILNEYNIVICTPGRLLQHLDQNPLMDVMNLQLLVLDEADRILDMGFQTEMNAIIEHLPQNRQTLLFSATQTRSVKDLARLSLKNPVYVSVHENSMHATPSTLEQNYIVCELHKKMDFIWSFLKNHKKQKILIFMASCKQVKYTFEVFCRMKPGVSLMALYGGLHQLKRMERYKDFCRKNHVVMFATDLAARGLDFPNVNWVVQLDCPEDVNTYIHRAGRTARYQNGGNSLLILLPSEKEAMVEQMKNRKIPISEIVVHPSKIISVQRKIELLCARDDSLHESAQRAFKSYYKSVYLMKDKSVFDINQLNNAELQDAFAKSLGLKCSPRIRFIQKRCKNVANLKQEKANEEESPSPLRGEGFTNTEKLDISSEDSDIESFCDKKSPILLKKEDKPIADRKKPLTKEELAKMVMKRKIKPNVKVKFNEKGEPVTAEACEELEVDKVVKDIEDDVEGFSIAQAAQLIGAEDDNDRSQFSLRIKRKHKEMRLKLKAQRNQDKEDKASAQLDAPEEEANPEGSSESAESSDEEVLPKRPKFGEETDSGDEDGDEDIQHPVHKTDLEDDEMLALHFLENT